MFARVFGPYLVIVCGVAVTHIAGMRTLVAEFDVNSVWAWVTGAFVLLCGLIVIALHPYWRGAAAVTISLLGWATALKGLFILAFPGSYKSFADSILGSDVWWRGSLLVMVLVGIYLTAVGWVPRSNRVMASGNGQRPGVRRVA